MRKMIGVVLVLVLLVFGCQRNSKNPFGVEVLQRKSTGSVKVLEIKGMTKEMSYHYDVKVGLSGKIMIGEFRGLQANLLLRFNNLSDTLKNATVERAILRLWRHSDIKASDATAFQADIHEITQAWDDSTIASWEEIQHGYDPVPLQSVQFTPEDTTQATTVDSLTMPIALIQTWADSTEENYGILLRSTAANFIKLFYSKDSAHPPELEVHYSTATQMDTVKVVATEDTYLVESTGMELDNRLVVGAGYGFASLLHFDVDTDSIPKGATINRAFLSLMVDTTQTILRENLTLVLSNMAVETEPATWSPPDISLDSTSTSTFSYAGGESDSLNITHLVQDWVSERRANYGLCLGVYSDRTELARLSFYDSSADSTFIPRVKIFYTTPPVKEF